MTDGESTVGASTVGCALERTGTILVSGSTDTQTVAISYPSGDVFAYK